MPRKPNSEAQVTPEVEAVETPQDQPQAEVVVATEVEAEPAPKAEEAAPTPVHHGKITVLPHGATVEDF